MSFHSERLIIGHRGAAGLAPENTLAGFGKAAALGVHAVELDVHCVGGRLLVVHDDHLDRTTSGSGELASLDIAELRALDAGGGQPIPYLEEVFDALPVEVGINVELKGPDTAEPVFSMLRDLARIAHQLPAADADASRKRGRAPFIRGVSPRAPRLKAPGRLDALATKVGERCGPGRPQRDVLVSSFDLDELGRFAKLARGAFKVAPLFRRWHEKIPELSAELSAWSVNLGVRAATRRQIRRARARGFRVLVYTVNDPVDAERLFSWGATGIFTDFPDRMIDRVAPGRG